MAKATRKPYSQLSAAKKREIDNTREKRQQGSYVGLMASKVGAKFKKSRHHYDVATDPNSSKEKKRYHYTAAKVTSSQGHMQLAAHALYYNDPAKAKLHLGAASGEIQNLKYDPDRDKKREARQKKYGY